jgi:hypothetical protein
MDKLDSAVLCAAAQSTGHGTSVAQLSRRVQRTRIDGVAGAAATHHLRGRSFLVLADLYLENVWDDNPRARRFFLKHRGFLARHTRADLPSFRKLFLRSALASAERGVESLPGSLECACLLACVTWALCESSPGGSAERRSWCNRLEEVTGQALALAGAPDEAALLYGARAGSIPTTHERRAMLVDIRCRAAALRDEGNSLMFSFNSAARPSEEGPCWTPWASPWRGLDLELFEAANASDDHHDV